ncbi:hypothetical protein H0G86_006606 [Trichoderma simmonsii]|uniref:Uncharacterized protein n=1 Tax=Trichoderma simmonsii TaxID=1491479 RepID=A0A8G0LF00_9HYPO|nr:hypothetical protein H0G86_006606 [Trichoderma simmonsii]
MPTCTAPAIGLLRRYPVNPIRDRGKMNKFQPYIFWMSQSPFQTHTHQLIMPSSVHESVMLLLTRDSIVCTRKCNRQNHRLKSLSCVRLPFKGVKASAPCRDQRLEIQNLAHSTIGTETQGLTSIFPIPR